jgi:hypothetical protein
MADVQTSEVEAQIAPVYVGKKKSVYIGRSSKDEKTSP